MNPSFPFIVLKDEFRRAKKNTIDFFEAYLPSQIISLEIADSDRVVKLELSSSSIYFAVRGKFTNVFLIDGKNSISFFKNYPGKNPGEIVDEIGDLNFISYLNLPEFNVENSVDVVGRLKAKYPFIGKDIFIEANSKRKSEDKNETLSSLKKTIRNVFNKNIIVYFDDKTFELLLTIEGFDVPQLPGKTEFEKVNDALQFYISKKYYYDSFSGKKKLIQKILEKELARLSAKLNSLKAVIDKGSSEEEYSQKGNLLLINRHKLKGGMTLITLENIYLNNEPISIKLDEKLSPQKNIDAYFYKAKNDGLRLENSKKLFKELTVKFENIKRKKEKLDSSIDIEEFMKVIKELKMDKSLPAERLAPGNNEEDKKNKEDIKSKFKHYIIDGKYNVYVGKDSKNNDLLTTRFAKQNDYWFHARSVPGSHVVLRVENTKEQVPKNILKKAAAIAAFHSKAKTSGLAPVSFTLKKYVTKRKDMEPGKVGLLKEDVLLVKPEIPSGCEYDSAE